MGVQFFSCNGAGVLSMMESASIELSYIDLNGNEQSIVIHSKKDDPKNISHKATILKSQKGTTIKLKKI